MACKTDTPPTARGGSCNAVPAVLSRHADLEVLVTLRAVCSSPAFHTLDWRPGADCAEAEDWRRPETCSRCCEALVGVLLKGTRRKNARLLGRSPALSSLVTPSVGALQSAWWRPGCSPQEKEHWSQTESVS